MQAAGNWARFSNSPQLSFTVAERASGSASGQCSGTKPLWGKNIHLSTGVSACLNWWLVGRRVREGLRQSAEPDTEMPVNDRKWPRRVTADAEIPTPGKSLATLRVRVQYCTSYLVPSLMAATGTGYESTVLRTVLPRTHFIPSLTYYRHVPTSVVHYNSSLDK